MLLNATYSFSNYYETPLGLERNFWILWLLNFLNFVPELLEWKQLKNLCDLRRHKFILQHDNIVLGHMSQDRSRHTWKRWNGRLYPSRCCSFRLPFVSIDGTRPGSSEFSLLWKSQKKSKNGSIRGSPQKTHLFSEMVFDNYQKDGKK